MAQRRANLKLCSASCGHGLSESNIACARSLSLLLNAWRLRWLQGVKKACEVGGIPTSLSSSTPYSLLPCFDSAFSAVCSDPTYERDDLRDERSDGPLGLISPNVACRRQACATLAYILFALGSSRQNGKGISLFRAGARMYARRRDSEAARQWLHSLKSL